MAGALILVDEFTTSSAVSSVTIGGGSSGSSSYNFAIDSTYDVYQLVLESVSSETDAKNLYMRVTKSGTAQTDSNYDWAYKALRSDTTFGNNGGDNNSYFPVTNYSSGTGTSEGVNGVMYLFGFSNASEGTFYTMENASLTSGELLISGTGGGLHTVKSVSDGLNFYYSSGNVASGSNFKLYGLKK